MPINSKSSNGKRILLVAHSTELYGAEKSLLDVVIGLSQRGWQATVIVPGHGGLTAALEEAQIPVVIQLHKAWIGSQPRLLRIPFRFLINGWAWWRLRRRLVGKFDLIYTNTIAKPLGAMLALSWKLPHLWHAREFVDADMAQTFDFGRNRSLAWIGRSSQRVICNSRAVRDMLAPHVPVEKLRVVYNGVLDDAAPRFVARTLSLNEKGPLALCMVGHLTEHKGHMDAIAALALLKQQGVVAQLEIAGDGPEGYRRELERQVVKLGLAAQVTFLGYQRDVTAVYARSDLHLVCSRCEAFGRVAVESMALGVPVVGADSGGLPEIVRDGRNGLLYAPGDSGALAAQIRRMLEEPGLYAAFSRQGQEDVYAAFGRAQCLDAIETILGEALTEAGGGD